MKFLSRLKTFLSDLSNRELNLWAELLVNIIVALYYFPNAFRLMKTNEWTPTGGAMIGLVVSTIILAIIISIVLAILVSIWKKPAKKDERDYIFSARGSMIAYMALFIFVAIIIGQLMFQGLFPEAAARLDLTADPAIIAHFLLLSLMFSSTIKCVAQLVSYRRGY